MVYIRSNFLGSVVIINSGVVPNAVCSYSTSSKDNTELQDSTINYSDIIKLDPWSVTGLTDGEGCFTISISKSNVNYTGYSIYGLYVIGFDKKDLNLLKSLKLFFNVGRIYDSKSNNMVYLKIASIKDLQVVINHFDNYPLMTQKKADYILFKKALEIISKKEHITLDGLKKIFSIKASLNLGLSEKLQKAFPDTIPALRPEVEEGNILNNIWLSGFTTGEGCFSVTVSKNNTKSGFAVKLLYSISQHVRDKELLSNISKYLDCGHIRERDNSTVVELIVTKFLDINTKIIPFFEKYPLLGDKAKDFNDFKSIAKIMSNKGHLTLEGVSEITTIKQTMNKGKYSK